MKRRLNASYFNPLGSSNNKLQLAVKAILRRVPAMRHMASLKWKHCTVPLQAPYYMLEVLFSSGENAVHQIFQHFDGIDKFQLHMLRILLNTLTCDHCAGVSGLLAEEMD